MEVTLARLHLGKKLEEHAQERFVQEGGGIALWRSEGHRDGFWVGYEDPPLLAEVPVEDLRYQLEEGGEEGVVFLGEGGKVEQQELLENLHS